MCRETHNFTEVVKKDPSEHWNRYLRKNREEVYHHTTGRHLPTPEDSTELKEVSYCRKVFSCSKGQLDTIFLWSAVKLLLYLADIGSVDDPTRTVTGGVS